MGDIRFGVDISDLPDELSFGDWGRLEMTAALDAFQESLTYFDQEEVIKAEEERQKIILAARRYYDGNHVKPLKIKAGDPDDNVLVNLCRNLIDDSVSWLFGDPSTGILTMRVDAEGDEAGEMLNQAYLDAGGFRFFKRLGMRGSIAGHFFIKLVNSEPPRPTALDPMIVALRTDPTDVDRVIAYKIEWRRAEIDPSTRRKEMFIYRQLVVRSSDVEEAWLIGDFKAKDRRKRQWVLVEAGAWPYAWSPIVDGPNIESGWGRYGLSDLEDVSGINDSINFLASNTMRILKFHAHPKTIGTGMDAEDLQETAIDSFWTVPDPDAKLNNLEMQSDLGSSMAFLDFLKTAFWGIGRGLDPATFKDKIGSVTNFALRVLAIRALHKTGDKRMTYGDALQTVNARLLEMMGRDERETLIEWPNALPEDPEQQLNELEREVGLGIASRQTAAEERGRSWDSEQKRIASESRERDDLGSFLLGEFDRGRPTRKFATDNLEEEEQANDEE